MPQQTISIKTADGTCPAKFFTPAGGNGRWPGVIFYMDAFGMRPAVEEMSQRLADAGYAVLTPDPYYRTGPYERMDPASILNDQAALPGLMQRVNSQTRATRIADTGAFLAWLDARPEVKGPKYGATGYCMGGLAALSVASAFPEKFAAVASFHGGNIAVEAPDSPHHFAPAIKARLYVAGADHDAMFTDEHKAVLEQALTAAGVEHEVVTYQGAYHGFAVPDMPVFNQTAAERHWDALLKLFKETLG